METALSFNQVQFDVVDHNGEPWVRVSQIATALQYASAQRVIELYTRHADEFTTAMTALVKLSTEGGEQEVRIFSLRGCHLLAMFARTPVAKDFRKWVLDVLDRLSRAERKATFTGLNPAERAKLRLVADAKLSCYPKEIQGKARAELWSRFNRHFQIASYSQLPPQKLDDAVNYIIDMQLRATEKYDAEPFSLEASHTDDVRQLQLLACSLLGRCKGYHDALEMVMTKF